MRRCSSLARGLLAKSNRTVTSSYRDQHAFALHDRATAAEEADNEHQNASGDQQDRGTQHVVGGCQRSVGALRHLQPDSNAKNCTAQQLTTATYNNTAVPTLGYKIIPGLSRTPEAFFRTPS